jgi:hypothetical protein
MSTCRWDREANDYLIDGEPCRVDDYGDPTRHCKARQSCSVHIGPDEITCPRCIGRARAHLARIPTVAALAVPVAVTSGVNSEAANIAGPAADPELWRDRRIAMRSHLAAWETLGRITEEQHLHARLTMEDDDERHPANVLGRWCLMISEDYGHDLPVLTVSNAAVYLDRQLARVANDPEQDFGLLASDLRKCRRWLEETIALIPKAERGVPCPDCVQLGVSARRMVREYGHWCDVETCEKVHYADDSADIWVCPRDRDHWRTTAEYDAYLAERKGA